MDLEKEMNEASEARMDRKKQQPMSKQALALTSTRQTLSVPEAGRVLGYGRNVQALDPTRHQGAVQLQVFSIGEANAAPGQ